MVDPVDLLMMLRLRCELRPTSERLAT